MIENGELVLKDGTRIDMVSGKKVHVETSHYEVPTRSEAQDIVVTARRKLADLPAMPEHMNVIGVILSYSLFGLENEEIAIATGLPLEQVNRIKMMAEYDEMHTAVTTQIMRGETENVRTFITSASMKAAKKMVQHIDSENEIISMQAAKDVMDRAGHRPADMIIEQRSKSESDLTIKFVKEDRTQPMPTIDMKPVSIEENTDGGET